MFFFVADGDGDAKVEVEAGESFGQVRNYKLILTLKTTKITDEYCNEFYILQCDQSSI